MALFQATGTSPDMKYESEGGPGILRIMKLLLASRLSLSDRKDFFRAQILFWMLAAIDGHAKNFSIFLEVAGRFSLTPLYDVLSAYPVMGHTAGKLAPEKVHMAMAVYGKNRHYRWNDISARHWIRSGELAGLSGELVQSILADLVERTSGVISKVSAQLPRDFPEAVGEPIFHGLEWAAERLLI